MYLSDKIAVKVASFGLDEHLNEVEVSNWVNLGKCLIVPNTSAKLIKSNDGKDYNYSHEVIMRKPKGYIPRENDVIHITKKDGTIDKDCRVQGFVTLKNWLKIWV